MELEAYYNTQELNSLTDDVGRKTKVYNDTLYTCDYSDTLYQKGLRALIADYYQRRVQDVMDFLPDVRCIFYGDLFDPQHIGGYFKTAAALRDLTGKTITVQSTTAPITEKVIFMPWLYSNTFTHELEGKFDGAELHNSVTSVLVGTTAAYLACGAIPSIIGQCLCKRHTAKHAYETLVTKNSIDIDVSYNATGGKYHLDSTLQYFVQCGFPTVFMNSFEKEDVTSHTLAQMVKVLEEPAKFTQTQRDSFMLGYATVAWGNPPESNTNAWLAYNSAYDQHFTYNNMEIFSANFNWSNAQNSMLMFGDVQRDRNFNLFWARNPVSVVDYFVTMKDLYNTYLDTQAVAPMTSANFYDAIRFCNLLSKREGLDTVYTLTNVHYNSLWNTADLDTVRASFEVKGPVILSASIQPDFWNQGTGFLQ